MGGSPPDFQPFLERLRAVAHAGRPGRRIHDDDQVVATPGRRNQVRTQGFGQLQADRFGQGLRRCGLFLEGGQARCEASEQRFQAIRHC